jgi:hypothetical protein
MGIRNPAYPGSATYGHRVLTVAMGIRLCLTRTNHLPQKFPLAHCVRGSFG